VLAEPNFAGNRFAEANSVPAAPAVLPCDAKGLEVVLATRVVAADAVELHGLMTVHRQHERPAEANALQFNVAFNVIDRCAAAFEKPAFSATQPPGAKV
jgi:hypothetical protein